MIFVFTLLSSNAFAALEDGLQGYWDFGTTSGKLIDIFKGNNSDTENITSRTAEGINGNAWNFTQSNSDWLAMPQATTQDVIGGSNRTISVWVYLQNFTSAGTVYSYGTSGSGAFNNLVIETTRVRYINFGDDVNVNIRLNNNTWYNFVTVFDRNAEKRFFYMNGTLIASKTGLILVTTSDPLDIGAERKGAQVPASHFPGLIDELAIWDRNLSSTEIEQLYGNETNASFCLGDPCIFSIPDDLPVIVQNNTNITPIVTNIDVGYNVNVSDDIGLSFVFVESNITGTLSNVTIEVSGTAANVTANFTNALIFSSTSNFNTTGFKIYVNDSYIR